MVCRERDLCLVPTQYPKLDLLAALCRDPKNMPPLSPVLSWPWDGTIPSEDIFAGRLTALVVAVGLVLFS